MPSHPKFRLRAELLESRITPSGLSDVYDLIATDPVAAVGAFHAGIGQGAIDIVKGAGHAIVETVRVVGDIAIIGTTDHGEFSVLRAAHFAVAPLPAIWGTDPGQIDTTLLNSQLFAGAAQTAGDPQAAANLDNQVVFGISTLGVGPLAVSGYNGAESGNSTEFSQQAGGFGIMVLVPYAGARGIGYVRVPVTAATTDSVVGVEGGVVRAGGAVAEPPRLPSAPEPMALPPSTVSEPVRVPVGEVETPPTSPSVGLADSNGAQVGATPSSTKGMLDNLPGDSGKIGPIKEVPNAKALEDLFDSLQSGGGKSVDPGTYPGVVSELPDGTIVRMRPGSKSGGATTDITMPDGKIFKVHIKQ